MVISIIKDLEKQIQKIYPEIVSVRRKLHRYPELSFNEKYTSSLIVDFLEKCQLKPKIIEESYSVVCDIVTDESIKKTVLRADIDALPIQEETRLSFSSINRGVMHACGHDIHISILLGVAKILSENLDQIKVNIRLLFQSGEEEYPGGAAKLVEKGYINSEEVKRAFGLHVSPELKTGTIGLHAGNFMASADEIHIKIIGKGGHAAKPDEFINPIYFASKACVMLCKPIPNIKNKYILSIGKFIADGATNVIPNCVEMQGTLRTFDEADRKKLHKFIKDTLKFSALHNVKYKLEILKGYPSLYNDPDLTEYAQEKLSNILGKENVVEVPERYTSDDFAYISKAVPSCYMRLGCNSNTRQHTSKFNPDEKSIYYGMLTFLILL
ncbi:MAG: M20 metallopeptidase family protein [Bacteroidales bacterium]|jgi:amidohydrolase